MIKTAYKSKMGADYKISDHFMLAEMACKDGSDKVLYSTELLEKLEKLRAYGGFTIHINSGYRTPSYNKKIGGASHSQHIYGTAADISVRKEGKTISGKLICCLCQTLGFRGVAYISESAVHVDMRSSGNYRGDERKGYSGNVGGNFFTYFNVKQSAIDALKVSGKETNVPTKEQEEDEMIYKDMNEVPEWGRESVQMRMEHGWTDGKNLTESMVRCWVIQDREDPYIVDLNDVPAWALSEVRQLMEEGKIKGNGVEAIGKRWSVVQAVMMASR